MLLGVVEAVLMPELMEQFVTEAKITLSKEVVDRKPYRKSGPRLYILNYLSFTTNLLIALILLLILLQYLIAHLYHRY